MLRFQPTDSYSTAVNQDRTNSIDRLSKVVDSSSVKIKAVLQEWYLYNESCIQVVGVKSYKSRLSIANKTKDECKVNILIFGSLVKSNKGNQCVKTLNVVTVSTKYFGSNRLTQNQIINMAKKFTGWSEVSELRMFNPIKFQKK